MSRARWIDLGLALLLVVAVFAAFRPALDAGFLAWDDDRNFLDNPSYRGLGREQLAWMFTTFHMGPYQPLAWVTLGLDHELHGLDPHGYHRTSVAIHALSVVVLFFAARRLVEAVRPTWSRSTTTFVALAAAVLFGLHPLRVESVAWVTERRDVVSGFFLALTLDTWLRAVADGTRRNGWYVASVCAFLAALLGKATVVGLPLALLALDVGLLGRWRTRGARILLEHAPFVVLAIVFSIVAVQGQAATGSALRGFESHGISQRLAQAAYSSVFYPWKTLWPANLSPIYDLPNPFDPYVTRFLVAAALVVAISIGVWLLRRRAPAVATAWIAFLVLLAPVSGLVSTGPQLVADRYSYVATLPLVLLAAGLTGPAFERASGAWRRVWIAGVVLVGVALGAATHAQTKPWRDTRSLWEHAHAIAPRSAVACQQLGVTRVHQANDTSLDVATRSALLNEALDLYAVAYEESPHPLQLFNIGGLLMQHAELEPSRRTETLAVAVRAYEDAMAFARETTGITPRWRVMYATALVEVGRRDEARTELEEALRADPRNVPAHLWLARVDQEQGHDEAAIGHLETATRLQPENATAWRALVALLERVGPPQRAAEALARARAAGASL